MITMFMAKCGKYWPPSSILATILMCWFNMIMLVQPKHFDLEHVWLQHTNQILSIYNQLAKPSPYDGGWNKSNVCRVSMKQLVEDARNNKFYANKMIDSIGRPTSGILEGRLTYLGQYDECIGTDGGEFSGKYCIAHIQLPSNFSHILSNISGVSSSLYKNLPPVKLGVCLPSTCSAEDVSRIAQKFSSAFQPFSVKVIECMENEADNNNENLIPLIVLGTISATIFLMVILGTAYDYYQSSARNTYTTNLKSMEEEIREYKPTTQTISGKILLAFSIDGNLKRILHVNETSNDSINVFHGIKFFAMIWIIILHSKSFSSQWINFNNPLDIKRTTYNVFSQILVNGTFSVDCFFFISGYLTIHSLQRLIVSNKKLNLTSFYLNRYIRMTPTMMFVIGFGATLLRYFGSGPEWTNSTVMFDLWCRKNWWINLLYLHNFINTDNMCLSHSWYSAVDVQFFIISPIIIILLSRKPWIGVGACLSLLFGSIGITWALTILNNYPAVPYFNDIIPLDVINSYYQHIYIKPYCRIGPYIVGVLMAYAMSNHRVSDVKLSRSQLFAGWTFTIVSTLGVILAMLPANNGHIPDVRFAAFYSSTSRIIWSLGLAWITFVSLINQGGFIQKLLSMKIWIPLSRLTYCAYLVHPVIIALFYGSRHQTFDYSFYLILYFTISNICITYVVSFWMALFIEYPLMSIGKLILNRSR